MSWSTSVYLLRLTILIFQLEIAPTIVIVYGETQTRAIQALNKYQISVCCLSSHLYCAQTHPYSQCRKQKED